MNGQDKKDLNVILEQMKQADKDRGQMHTDIKFIKEIYSIHTKDYGLKQNSIGNSEKIQLNGVVSLVLVS